MYMKKWYPCSGKMYSYTMAYTGMVIRAIIFR